MVDFCVKCEIEFESFLMKNGKPSKKCPKHYEMDREREAKRPQRVRKYPKKEEMTAEQLATYQRKIDKRRDEGRVKRDTQKYREKKKQTLGMEEYLKQNAEQARNWRAKNKGNISAWRRGSIGSTLGYYKKMC